MLAFIFQVIYKENAAGETRVWQQVRVCAGIRVPFALFFALFLCVFRMPGGVACGGR